MSGWISHDTRVFGISMDISDGLGSRYVLAITLRQSYGQQSLNGIRLSMITLSHL